MPLFRRAAMAVLSACMAALSASITARLLLLKPQKRRKRRSRRSAKYLRAAILHPTASLHLTPWKQILSCGDNDFLVSTNLTRSIVLDTLLPLFPLPSSSWFVLDGASSRRVWSTEAMIATWGKDFAPQKALAEVLYRRITVTT